MTTFEERLMLAMHLETVEELDELLSGPISEDAGLHSEPPDEEYDLADQMYEAQDLFAEMREAKYLN
jgi:hypothetical protein